VIGHVGSKVSALVDGQLPAAESDRLWAHVHRCATCRHLVEREGWIKTRLVGLSLGSQPAAPQRLRGALSVVGTAWSDPPAPATTVEAQRERRRVMVVAALGAGSMGAAMVGVLALAVPAQAPGVDRRAPVTSLNRPTATAPVPTTSPRLPMSARLARAGATQQRWVTITP
jgi:anti-sigma factor RsiW